MKFRKISYVLAASMLLTGCGPKDEGPKYNTNVTVVETEGLSNFQYEVTRFDENWNSSVVYEKSATAPSWDAENGDMLIVYFDLAEDVHLTGAHFNEEDGTLGTGDEGEHKATYYIQEVGDINVSFLKADSKVSWTVPEHAESVTVTIENAYYEENDDWDATYANFTYQSGASIVVEASCETGYTVDEVKVNGSPATRESTPWGGALYIFEPTYVGDYTVEITVRAVANFDTRLSVSEWVGFNGATHNTEYLVLANEDITATAYSDKEEATGIAKICIDQSATEWRFYKAQEAKLMITANEGELISVTVGFGTSNYAEPIDKIVTVDNGVAILDTMDSEINSNFNIKYIVAVVRK